MDIIRCVSPRFIQISGVGFFFLSFFFPSLSSHVGLCLLMSAVILKRFSPSSAVRTELFRCSLMKPTLKGSCLEEESNPSVSSVTHTSYPPSQPATADLSPGNRISLSVSPRTHVTALVRWRCQGHLAPWCQPLKTRTCVPKFPPPPHTHNHHQLAATSPWDRLLLIVFTCAPKTAVSLRTGSWLKSLRTLKAKSDVTVVAVAGGCQNTVTCTP